MRTIRIPLARTAAAAAAAVVMAGGLAACGSSASTTTTATSAPAAAQASPTGQRTGQRFDPAMMTKITQCLQAAGIAVPTFTRRPSGSPVSPRPSGQRTGGGGFGRFANPQAQAALKACGIVLPTRPPGAGGAAPAPSATN